MNDLPKKPGSGGKRVGAGRKPADPLNPCTARVNARVEPDLKTFAQKQQGGESEYIRRLLRQAEFESRVF